MSTETVLCLGGPDQEHCYHCTGERTICCWCGKGYYVKVPPYPSGHGQYKPNGQ